MRLYSETGIHSDWQVPQGSIANPADAQGCLTVGAVETGSMRVAYYSSHGPTEDGRAKPDIYGPTDVTTWSYWPIPFNGTSAATPHIAGAAALVKEYMPKADVATLREFLVTHVHQDFEGENDGAGFLSLPAGEAPEADCEPETLIGNLANLPFEADGSTLEATNRVQLVEACTVESWGRDRTYQLGLPKRGGNPRDGDTGEGYDPMLLIQREECSAQSPCLAGADDHPVGDMESLVFKAPERAFYQISVDSSRLADTAEASGSYSLRIELVEDWDEDDLGPTHEPDETVDGDEETSPASENGSGGDGGCAQSQNGTAWWMLTLFGFGLGPSPGPSGLFPESMNEVRATLFEKAQELGFGPGGVSAPVLEPRFARALEEWLHAGRHASMTWMASEPARRSDARHALPSCKAVVVFTLPYNQPVPSEPPEVGMGRISRYLLGRDYHRLAEKQGRKLVRWLRETYGGQHRFLVDSGPLLERAFAYQAGLGFFGKHGNLITDQGSFVFLACLLTSLELPFDAPRLKDCGSCRLCLDACPTGALVAPHVVDARRCIGYWTIEHKGPIPEDIRPHLSPWLAGCDRCQEVCPYNRIPKSIKIHPDFQTHRVEPWVFPEHFLSMKQEEFTERFQGNGLARPGLPGLRRNAAYAMGNLESRHFETNAIAKLQQMIHSEKDAVVAEALRWALARRDTP